MRWGVCEVCVGWEGMRWECVKWECEDERILLLGVICEDVKW